MNGGAESGTLVLTATDVRAVLDIATCIDAVELAFRMLASGNVIAPGILATHVPGGGFHIKTAGIRRQRYYYASKINANFPGNPVARGLPTIQGVVALFNAESGEVLALMDSIEITALRTAAASAVAARHLAPSGGHRLTIIGCGTQGHHHAPRNAPRAPPVPYPPRRSRSAGRRATGQHADAGDDGTRGRGARSSRGIPRLRHCRHLHDGPRTPPRGRRPSCRRIRGRRRCRQREQAGDHRRCHGPVRGDSIPTRLDQRTGTHCEVPGNLPPGA